MTRVRWATFDCYGTLVDWLHGVSTSFELLVPGAGAGAVEAFVRHETQVQQADPRRRYRSVLIETARRMATDLGIALNEDDADVLATTLPYWPVFPDTVPALARLRGNGVRIALLTNCDRDLNSLTRRRIGVPIDAAITAEDVGAYKPSTVVFETFRERFDVQPGDWVHVAESHYHDVVPAHSVDVPAIWINRLGQNRDASVAAAVLPDLTSLPATVAAVMGW
jgi:2-haloacid dehalogenase